MSEKPSDKLCGEAKEYTAVQRGNTVILTAIGEHVTTGYVVILEKSLITIFPPEFSLKHLKPTGGSGDAITPFTASIVFRVPEPIQYVIVHDANGPQTVPVKQVAGWLSRMNKETFVQKLTVGVIKKIKIADTPVLAGADAHDVCTAIEQELGGTDLNENILEIALAVLEKEEVQLSKVKEEAAKEAVNLYWAVWKGQ